MSLGKKDTVSGFGDVISPLCIRVEAFTRQASAGSAFGSTGGAGCVCPEVVSVLVVGDTGL